MSPALLLGQVNDAVASAVLVVGGRALEVGGITAKELETVLATYEDIQRFRSSGGDEAEGDDDEEE
jgi:hypothetical protein